MQITAEIVIPPALEADALARAPRLLDDEIRKTMHRNVLLIEGAVSERAPVNLGHLRGATQSEVKGTGVQTVGRVWNPALYAPAVEAGGRAHWAPLRNILAWARRVIGGTNANRVGRAVWVAISQSGTKARPFWAPAWRVTAPAVRRNTEQMLARMVRRLAGES